MDAETKQEVSVSGKEKGSKHLPLAAIARPFEELERRFEQLFNRGWMRPFSMEPGLWSEMLEPLEMRWPKLDMIDRENEVVVRAEVPGMDKKDIEVSITDYTLTIKGQTRQEKKQEKGNYYRSEIHQGSFSRSVYLPAGVDATKVSATMRDGILEVTLPKLEGSKGRSIKVE